MSSGLGASAPLRPGESQRKREWMHEIFEAVGLKGELGRTARRYLRRTPEYAQARAEHRARVWLAAESSSMATYLYEAMTTRELEP